MNDDFNGKRLEFEEGTSEEVSDPSSPKSRSSALIQRDPLTAYLTEIRKYGILTPEEERKFAIQYYETGDPAAAFKMITSNLGLVVKIALQYRRGYLQIIDLIQEGNIGLMQAVKKYDPYKGVRLPSYAQYWIRAYILRYILANFRMVKIGTSEDQRKIFYNLKKERDALIKEGFEPSTKLLAARMDVSEEEVEAMGARLYAGDVSLDAPVGEDASTTMADFIPSGSATPEEEASQSQIKAMLSDKIAEFGKTLKPRNKVFWEKRIIAEDPVTLQDLADEYGISRERARQIDEALREKFKKFLEKTMGKNSISDFYEE